MHRDLEAVTARSYYLPAGAADALQIQLTADRVRVWTTGDFTRPVKLLPREALALGLGLRSLASAGGADADPDRLEALRRRLERHLATAPTDRLQERFEPAGDTAPTPPDDVPGTLFDCARSRTPCRIRYLKPGAPAPEARTVHTYVVARAEGRWYAVGRDPDAGDDRVRIFRLDRIVEADAAGGTFTVPDAFEPSDYVNRGRLYRADDDVEVVVRYSPRIARWIREKPWAGEVAGSEEQEDGGLVVRHRVTDPRWIVGHVLQYGPDAEVLGPEEVRERVVEAVEELIA